MASTPTNLMEALRSLSSVLPGGNVALGTGIAGSLGVVQGAAQWSNAFGAAGRAVGGWPGQVSAALVGAGLGAMGGFGLGTAWASGLVKREESDILDPKVSESISFDPGDVPRGALSNTREEVSSINIVGATRFGEDVAYTGIRDNLYALDGTWAGFLTGLLYNRTAVPQLFQTPPAATEPITEPPVPREEVTAWTNGHYVAFEGSSVITEGIGRLYFVPMIDGSILFLLNSAHFVNGGTAGYAGSQGIKQGIGAVVLPPGQVPGNFPAPNVVSPSSSIDTYRLIRNGFLRTGAAAARPETEGSASAEGLELYEASTAVPDVSGSGSRASVAVSSRVDSVLPSSLREVVKRSGGLPFDLPLPDVSGAVPEFYKDANLFRRITIGEGQVSTDRKYFRFQGDVRCLNEDLDGSCAGIYEFVLPLREARRELPAPASVPFDLDTLSINEVEPRAFSKQRWDFTDGSLTASGSALFHAVELETEEVNLWISTYYTVTSGGGRFEGARGIATSGVSILVPKNETLATVTKVEFKAIDLFVVLRQQFVGELDLSALQSL